MKTLLKIPYINLIEEHAAIKEELLSAVAGVLDEGQFVLGPQVEEFEKQFAALCGVKFALGVNSGTDALIFALRALGVSNGDEVITVANSFVSSASCIVAVGAKPVFVDVGEDFNIDPSLVERVITKKTKAILPVHFTGRPAAMGPLLKLAQARGIKIVEDCAQAVGAEYKGKKVGSFGLAGCFSLHPLKTLNACGDGGVVVTNDSNIYDMIKAFRDNGFRSRNDCIYWSHNSRLDTLQAAILLVKLKYLEKWTNERRENARRYQRGLQSIAQITIPQDQDFEKAVYHTFMIQAHRRDALKDFLSERGVDTKIHYPIPIHLQPMARSLGYSKGSLPQTENQAEHILSLPIYSGLGEEKIDYVCRLIREFFQTKGVS